MTLEDGDLDFDEGVDRSIWQARMEDLEPDLETAPREALPELARLIAEMEAEEGVADTADPGDEDTGEVMDVARRLDAGEQVSDEEVSDALAAGKRLAWYLIEDRRGPESSADLEE